MWLSLSSYISMALLTPDYAGSLSIYHLWHGRMSSRQRGELRVSSWWHLTQTGWRMKTQDMLLIESLKLFHSEYGESSGRKRNPSPENEFCSTLCSPQSIDGGHSSWKVATSDMHGKTVSRTVIFVLRTWRPTLS